jgi:penicillin-binding protein 1C
MIKKIKRTVLLVFLLGLILVSASSYLPIPKERLHPGPVVSLSLVDRNGTLLREILSDRGGRCRWIQLQDVPAELVQATLVAEDKYFFLHPGINLFAVIRALYQNIRDGRIVSGASTISQQVVRNVTLSRRTIFAKIREAWLAIRLERTLSKEEILTQYLNRIYYGNQANGLSAASKLYFDKKPEDLSLAEAAFLAGLPRSPSTLDPYRHFRQAKKSQERILSQMCAHGYIEESQEQRAKSESLQLIPAKQNFRTPHFCDYVLQQIPSSQLKNLSRIQTTCDYRLQEKIETLVRDHINSLDKKGITNAAVMVLDNLNGEILSMVGSKDFFDHRHHGQVNGAVSLRQPGSTLKPFTYALALEKGMTAAEILEDREMYFSTQQGSYSPRNYDKKFHGPVRLRQALACSYNVAAVSLLGQFGPDPLYQRLKQLGFASLDKSSSHYGIGLTLGNGEVTLLELSRAYAALARGGIYLEDRSILKCFDKKGKVLTWDDQRKSQKIFSPQIAFLLASILADRDARVPAFGYISPLNLPFECAVKTGTTKDFRDNWTVGFTPRYTVGVWVGNFDGNPMHNISGVTGCGPLFKDIMLLLENKNPEIKFPKDEKLIKIRICPLSGKLASEHCPGAIDDFFIKGTEPDEYCDLHTGGEKPRNFPDFQRDEFRILFPLDKDVFKIDPVLRQEYQRIKLKTSSPEDRGFDRVEWFVDNCKIGSSSYPYILDWKLIPGKHIITAIAVKEDSRKKSRAVEIYVEN